MGLQGAAHEQIELLVRTAHFHVSLESHGVIALAEGVEELVDRDGALLAEAFFKVVAFHHAGHGAAGGQRMKSAAFMEPSQVELKATSVFSGSKILKTCFL